jgi:hypothetical protein
MNGDSGVVTRICGSRRSNHRPFTDRGVTGAKSSAASGQIETFRGSDGATSGERLFEIDPSQIRPTLAPSLPLLYECSQDLTQLAFDQSIKTTICSSAASSSRNSNT